MTLNELKYLVAVADLRHFHRAAARCHISQPSLSAAVKQVEVELGVRIFERSKAGVIVTEVGVEIIAQARRALEAAERVRSCAAAGKHPLEGVLRLGVIHTIAPYLLPGLVGALRRVAPAMPLDVEESTTASLDRMLRGGELDAVILALPYAAPGVEVRPLYDEDLIVAVPTGHPLSKRRSVGVEELDAADLLMLPAGHCLRDQVLGACIESSRQPPAGRQGNSLETLRSMVASGLGVTVLPATALVERYASPLVKAVPFAAPRPQRRVAIAWRAGFQRTAAIERIAASIGRLQLPVSACG